MKPKVAGTGLSGLIGSRIKNLLETHIDFIEISQREVDITNKDAVNEYVSQLGADYMLHLAAYTNVDACEQNKDIAHKVNVEGTQNLFEATEKNGIKFIFVSTGFVFDGNTPPFDEDSQTNPISYYGKTKLLGEEMVKNKGMIIRIDYPYGNKTAQKKDFVMSIINDLREKNPIRGISDQTFTPTYIDDIAYALQYLIAHYSPEVFHIVGADSVTGMEAIETIGKVFEIDTSWVNTTSYKEFYKGRALRPQKNVMVTKKNTFYNMRTFEEGLVDLRSRMDYHFSL